jgi:hypothetical protein
MSFQLQAIDGGAEVVFDKVIAGERYRVSRTPFGYLVSARRLNVVGTQFNAEWLHQTKEAALACVDAVVATNAVLQAVEADLPSDNQFLALNAAIRRYREITTDMSDKAVVGEEIRELRSRPAA